MSRSDEINKAIGAHGMWKQRLRTAIDTSSSDITVAVARTDNTCAFGTWLYGLPAAERTAGSAAEVRKLHAEFHTEAARVLQLALSGQKPEAERALGANSAFAAKSGELTAAMMRWRQA